MEQARPTKKQRELLSFIDGFIKGNGYGPSYREVMRALDYKSVSTVATHVDGLIARGWLVKRDHSARSLEVVGASDTPAAKPGKATAVKKGDESAGQAIRDKLEALKGEKSAEHDEDIAVLEKALVILGYEEPAGEA